MARPRLAVRPVEKTISIPIDIIARLDLEMFSELEGKVPHGKWSKLVVDLLRQHIRNLDAIRRTNDAMKEVSDDIA